MGRRAEDVRQDIDARAGPGVAAAIDDVEVDGDAAAAVGDGAIAGVATRCAIAPRQAASTATAASAANARSGAGTGKRRIIDDGYTRGGARAIDTSFPVTAS